MEAVVPLAERYPFAHLGDLAVAVEVVRPVLLVETIEMKRVVRTDPFIEELIQRESETMKSWVEAIATTHLWEAPLPEGLESGVHTVSVRATDEYGRTHTDHKIFEVYSMNPVESME